MAHPRTPLFLFAILAFSVATSAARAQEVCGLAEASFENLLNDSFESQAGIATRSVSTKRQPARIVPVPRLGKAAPVVTITFPTAGAVIAGGRLQVRGTFVGDATSGISVQGVPAYVVGNAFLSEELRLGPAASIAIEVRASNLAGESSSQTVTVSATDEPPALEIESTRGATFPDSQIDIVPIDNGLSNVNSVAVDFDGDGNDEFTGSTLAAAPRIHRFPAPGIYLARIQVGTSQGMLTAQRPIVVLDFDQHRARPCALLGILRARLNANDVAGALQVFPPDVRARYQPLFDALGANRPVMASRLGTIANGAYGLRSAELFLVYQDGGEDRAAMLGASQGGDGVWRIDSL